MSHSLTVAATKPLYDSCFETHVGFDVGPTWKRGSRLSWLDGRRSRGAGTTDDSYNTSFRTVPNTCLAPGMDNGRPPSIRWISSLFCKDSSINSSASASIPAGGRIQASSQDDARRWRDRDQQAKSTMRWMKNTRVSRFIECADLLSNGMNDGNTAESTIRSARLLRGRRPD